MFSSQPKAGLGLDIGTTNIRLIQIKRKKETLEINSIAIQDIEGSPAKTLKNLINSLKLEAKAVSTNLSGQGVVMRYIEMPSMTSEELHSAIRFEAEKYIPFPVNEVILDAKVIKEQYKGNKMLVLLVAAKKELIQNRLNLLNSVGLEAAVIDIDSLAVVNAFNLFRSKTPAEKKEEKPQPKALLNIEDSTACLSILEEELPVFSRDIILTEKGISIERSESALINLANEVRLSFDFYESQGNSPVLTLFLSGAIKKIQGLEMFLNQNLGAEVKTWNPISKITLNPGLDEGVFKDREGELAVVLGLALR